MSRYLLDTHVWIWELHGSSRQPHSVRRLFETSADSIWLSPISVWEAGMLARGGRIRLKTTFSSWLDEAFQKLPLTEAPVNNNVASRSLELDLGHQDPADHLLIATASIYDLVLVTLDERLTRQDLVSTFPG